MTIPVDSVQWADAAFKDGRNEASDKIESYMAGAQPIAFATAKFRKAFGNLFNSFAYNRMSSVVEAHADRLQVSGLGANDLATIGAISLPTTGSRPLVGWRP